MLINKNSKLVALFIKAEEKLNFSELGEYDILALKFELNNENEIKSQKVLLEKLLPLINKPLMICGCGKEDLDKIFLPELIKCLNRECIISYVTEKTYKYIIPSVISGGHYVILKTPIDINLAKELNILSVDMGLSKDKIIMNTDIGGLGYGYEYGYSIMEKIRIENLKGDEYLDSPLISEASIESMKTKEYKTSSQERRSMIEITSAVGAIAAGANIIVISNPNNINYIKEIF